MCRKASANILTGVISGVIVPSFSAPVITEDTVAMKSVQGLSN